MARNINRDLVKLDTIYSRQMYVNESCQHKAIEPQCPSHYAMVNRLNNWSLWLTWATQDLSQDHQDRKNIIGSETISISIHEQMQITVILFIGKQTNEAWVNTDINVWEQMWVWWLSRTRDGRKSVCGTNPNLLNSPKYSQDSTHECFLW